MSHTGDCSDAIVSLDIDGDGEFDDVLHALEETGPVLRVCLHDGPLSEMGGGGTFDEEDGWPVYDFWGCADMDADGRIDLVSADGVRVRPDLYAFDLTGYTIAGATAREIGSERIESPAPDRMAPNDPYRCPPNA